MNGSVLTQERAFVTAEKVCLLVRFAAAQHDPMADPSLGEGEACYWLLGCLSHTSTHGTGSPDPG